MCGSVDNSQVSWPSPIRGCPVSHFLYIEHMKTFVCLALVLMFSMPAIAQRKNSKEDWIRLFNGKDLADWTIQMTGHEPNENFNNTFVVDSAILKVNYDNYTEFGKSYGHIYYKTPFSYYKLIVEYRFVGQQTKGGATWNVRNSGVMFHSQPPSTLGKDQEFPVSLEAQFLGGLSDGKERTTANLCTPGTMIRMNGKLNSDHCINSTSATYEGDQWVTVEIRVYGDSLIQHVIDDRVVLEYSKPVVGETARREYFLQGWGMQNEGLALKEGYIALQAESHPIHFRRVELLNLVGCMNQKCKEYRSYFVKEGGCKCKGR